MGDSFCAAVVSAANVFDSLFCASYFILNVTKRGREGGREGGKEGRKEGGKGGTNEQTNERGVKNGGRVAKARRKKEGK